MIDKANKYIDNTHPWVLAKNEADKPRLMAVIYNLLEAIRVCVTALMPFLTRTPSLIFEGLGIEKPEYFEGNLVYGKIKNYETKETGILFPRLDIAKELKELEKIANASTESAKKEVKTEPKKEEVKAETTAEPEFVTADEFFKTKLVVGEILACEKVEKADRLLKSTVKIGDEIRTIVSGIAKFYTPEEMVDKRVVVVSNLAPRKIRGIESRGMLLCAVTGEGDDEKLCLIAPEKLMDGGSEVC